MESTARIECFDTRNPQIFDLKRDLLIALFRDWLRMKEVARFDTAICNREYRPQYLSVLSSGDIIFKGSGEACDILHGNCVEWLIARKVGIRSLSCSQMNRFREADITGRMLLKIAKLSGPSLTKFCLRNWKDGISVSLMSRIVSFCGNIQTLKYIDCSKNLIDDVMVMSACTRLSNLKEISVRNLNISDISLKTLASHCPFLVFADFELCKNIRDDGVKALANGCPCLEYINLNFVDNITNEGVIALARGCKRLRHLLLCNSSRITDKSIRKVAMSCPHLTTISLSHCHNLTSSSLEVLANHSNQLCNISINGCLGLTEPFFIYFIRKRGAKLLEIDIGVSDYFTDASLHTIAHMCPNLESFLINYNDHITDYGVAELIRGCPRLNHLELCHCANITNATLYLLLDHCPNLKYLHVNANPLMTQEGVHILLLERNGLRICHEYEDTLRGAVGGGGDDDDDDDEEDDDEESETEVLG